MSEVFGVFSTRKGRRTLLVLVLIYVAVALPFRSLEFLPGLTDIRPVCMLMPVYGLFYGPVGAWAFGLGNLIGDVAAHDLTWASVGGLLANFAAVYVYHVLLNRLSRSKVTLRDWGGLGQYLLAVLAATTVTVVILTPAAWLAFPSVDVAYFTQIVLINNVLFAVVPGMAIIIIMETEYHLTPYGSAEPGRESARS